MTDPKSDGFEVLQGYPPDVVAVAAHGQITHDDYKDVLIPLVEKTVKDEGKAKFLYVIAADFDGFTAGAAWEDAAFGMLHQNALARIAVVTDVEWLRLGLHMFTPLIRCPVKLFSLAEVEDARAWILHDKPEPPHSPEVAADHKLPTLEDKM